MVGSPLADLEFYRPKALRATPFIGSAFFVGVNPNINVAAVKLYADEFSLLLFFRQIGLLRLLLRLR